MSSHPTAVTLSRIVARRAILLVLAIAVIALGVAYIEAFSPFPDAASFLLIPPFVIEAYTILRHGHSWTAKHTRRFNRPLQYAAVGAISLVVFWVWASSFDEVSNMVFAGLTGVFLVVTPLVILHLSVPAAASRT